MCFPLCSVEVCLSSVCVLWRSVRLLLCSVLSCSGLLPLVLRRFMLRCGSLCVLFHCVTFCCVVGSLNTFISFSAILCSVEQVSRYAVEVCLCIILLCSSAFDCTGVPLLSFVFREDLFVFRCVVV